jgi:hypothetical protein
MNDLDMEGLSMDDDLDMEDLTMDGEPPQPAPPAHQEQGS